MKTNITPIRTWYKGFEFRSRTEARWAFALDQLGLRYEYEWEGFALPGRWYLPDFLLEDSMFVEIKPPMPTGAELLLAAQLSKEFNAATLVMLGSPSIDGKGILISPKVQTFTPIPQAEIFNRICAASRLEVISQALGRAQAARFEHGERPTIDKELLKEIWTADEEGGGRIRVRMGKREWWVLAVSRKFAEVLRRSKPEFISLERMNTGIKEQVSWQWDEEPFYVVD